MECTSIGNCALSSGFLAPLFKQLWKKLPWWVVLLCLIQTNALGQFTLNMPPNQAGLASPTPDGGFWYPHLPGSFSFGYSKYDSNAIFQYGYQYPFQGSGLERYGKVFAITGTSNYYVDIAKIDMATGAMLVKKRIQGPTGGQTYFTPGPAIMIATQDSGLLLVLNPQQCYQIANCDVCQLKLDKNLNYQFFSFGNFSGGSGLPNLFAVENADASITIARNVNSVSNGYTVFLARYNGTTGAITNHLSIYSPGITPFLYGLSSDANQIMLVGDTPTDGWVMSVSTNLGTVNWWNKYAGMNCSYYNRDFTLGPYNTYFGYLGNAVMALTSTGQVKWAKNADGGLRIYPRVPVGSNKIMAVSSPVSPNFRAAIIDTSGAGLCTPVAITPSVTTLVPSYNGANLSSGITNYFSITALPLAQGSPLTSTYTLQCSALCTFNATFSATTNSLTANFSSLPVGASSCEWDFGDGGTSTLQNPSHTYAVHGTYNVCLIATSICMADTVCQQVTLICPPSVAGFGASTNALTTTFTNSSTTTGTASYLWDFGDGNSSTSTSPSHTYSTPGYYNVCLIASGTCGSDTLCTLLNVGCTATVAAFSSSSNLLSAQFTNASTAAGAISYLWDFGDGSSDTSANPLHTYAVSGTYTVCLVANSPCGSDTTCQTVTIVCDPPTISFTALTNTSLTAVFTSTVTGSGNLILTWTFGDGNTSNVANPTYTYAAPGNYLVCLIASGPCGADTVCGSVDVFCPPLVAMWGAAGTFPTILFHDQSAGSPSAWLWDFGDGGTSALQHPSHTYATAGTYNVCLTIQDSCSQDSTCQSVDVLAGIPSAPDLQIEVYPNPSAGVFHVRLVNVPTTATGIQLFTSDGRLLLNQECWAEECLLDIQAYAAGTYWLSLRMGELRVTKPIFLSK
jgi:PKD repeat protein